MSRENMANNLGMRGSMIMGGGDGSYVSAEALKKVDTAVETLIGVANGAGMGALIAGGASSIASIAENGRENWMQPALKNATGKHLIPMLAATTALGALGGVVRYSRAHMHNEWSDKHYSFLAQQAEREAGSHAATIEKERNESEKAEKTR